MSAGRGAESRGKCVGQLALNCVPFSSAGLVWRDGNLVTEFGRTNVYWYRGGVY